MNIAFLQQDIVWEDVAANHELVLRMLDGLDEQVDIIVVPETFTTGFTDSMARRAELPMGTTYRFACSVTQRFDALFVGTWAVQDPYTGLVYNRLHWVRPDGNMGCYDKGHTFRMSSEAEQVAKGDRIETFEWRGWRIRPAVCYDLRFPTWLRNSRSVDGGRELDYDLLLLCANWPASRRDAWNTLLKARAIENMCYVAGVNRVGIDGMGLKYSGDSVVLDYCGRSVVAADVERQQLCVAHLSMDGLKDFRQRWPFYLDFD